ncbi:MAG: response regulator [Magnetococcales bacterium]|nr:response regulator [Magnetococcales bacterium]
MTGMINQRVLVIDDDRELLETYQGILSPARRESSSRLKAFAEIPEQDPRSGFRFEVTLASQGEEGVDQVRRSVGDNRPFAVAFIDMRMPPGIDGLETAARIRALDDRIYILIVTAFSDRPAEEIQMCLRHDVLLARKPLTKDEILQQARNFCNRWQEDEKLRLEGEKTRERAEQLDLNRIFLMEVIAALPEGVILCSPRGRIRYVNDSAVKMIGCSSVQLQDKLVDLIFPAADIRTLLSGIVENNLKPRHLQRSIRNGRGDDLPVLLSGSPLCDATGHVRFVLLSLIDSSDLEHHLQRGANKKT